MGRPARLMARRALQGLWAQGLWAPSKADGLAGGICLSGCLVVCFAVSGDAPVRLVGRRARLMDRPARLMARRALQGLWAPSKADGLAGGVCLFGCLVVCFAVSGDAPVRLVGRRARLMERRARLVGRRARLVGRRARLMDRPARLVGNCLFVCWQSKVAPCKADGTPCKAYGTP